jgi:excisionase family DNA binding protein
MGTTTTTERPALLTLRQAGEMLGLSYSTMKRVIAAGALEPVRIKGLRPRYRRVDVEALIRGPAP